MVDTDRAVLMDKRCIPRTLEFRAAYLTAFQVLEEGTIAMITMQPNNTATEVNMQPPILALVSKALFFLYKWVRISVMLNGETGCTQTKCLAFRKEAMNS